jgi:hypothetical protein
MGSIDDIFVWTSYLLWERVPSFNLRESNLRMALFELRMLLSALVLKYKWTGVPDKPANWDEEMKPFDTMLIHPRCQESSLAKFLGFV